MAQIDILYPFTQPIGPIIQRHFDWIFFTCLLLVFFGVVGIALRQRFKDSRALRTLITGMGLLITLTVYIGIYSGKLKLDIEGFAMYGMLVLFMLLFFILFVVFQIFRSESAAFMLAYCITYVVAWVSSKDFFDKIADTIPIVNGILTILWVVFVIILMTRAISFAKSQGPDISRSSRLLDRVKTIIPKRKEQTREVEREIKDDKKEQKTIKKETVNLTDREIGNLKDMKADLYDMARLIRAKGDNMNRDEVGKLKFRLRRLANEEQVLRKGLELFPRQLKYIEIKHTKQRDEIRNRIQGVKDQDQRKALLAEITEHNQALRYLSNMNSLNEKTVETKREFDRCIYTGMKRINEGKPGETMSYLKQANNHLNRIASIYRSQRELEKQLIDLSKRIIKDLNYEKDALKR